MKKTYSRPQSIETEIFVEGVIASSFKVGGDDVKGSVGTQHIKDENPIWGE